MPFVLVLFGPNFRFGVETRLTGWFGVWLGVGRSAGLVSWLLPVSVED